MKSSFVVGDIVEATTLIYRLDHRSKLGICDKAEVIGVWEGENYQILDVRPLDKSQVPMIDICCEHDKPFKKCEL